MTSILFNMKRSHGVRLPCVPESPKGGLMRKTSHSLLWFAPVLIVMAAFFASIPWLEDLDDAVTLSIASAASVFVVVWGRFVATRMERDLDEVQLAGQRFAQAKGAAGGTFITFLLLLPTPVVDWVTDNLILMTTGSGETPERDMGMSG